ncbi:28S ribosomal protein S7, mitochondrial [Venturia canescens]|uniref:28S ribosomal protein S7, mitochondrial n=1 Tax=Venturia canescens TaxID=32260 RepID=UPI001C9BE254|nr:28S ribosomal protein S7, mitochondrial [Venturia canescens]
MVSDGRWQLGRCFSQAETFRSVKKMAKIAALTGRFSYILKSATSVSMAKAISTRLYSMYPPYYIKPTFKKEEIAGLIESGEVLEIAHTPILPAHTNNTSSEFHDPAVTKFINFIMRKGNKILARSLLEKTFENVKRIQLKSYHSTKPENKHRIELDPVKVFHQAVENVTPIMELLKMKRGGVTYQVPVPILEKRQRFLAMNWLIQAAKDKEKKVHLPETLAKELVDASYNQGRVVKKKQDLHKQCEANRAYAHYRWL